MKFPHSLALASLLTLITTTLPASPPERLVIGAEGGKGLAIVDPADGNKVLWHRPLGAVHDLHLLPDFSLLTQDGWPRVIQVEGGFAITAVHLILKAKIPGASQAQFDELSKKAKEGCPVSKVLNATITLDGTLVS